MVTRTTPIVGAGNLATNYLHRDHLGSVDAITDETGAVIQRMSFDEIFVHASFPKTGVHFLGSTCGQMAQEAKKERQRLTGT